MKKVGESTEQETKRIELLKSEEANKYLRKVGGLGDRINQMTFIHITWMIKQMEEFDYTVSTSKLNF